MATLSTDALIFDVDGVLLDVSNSFPEVIRRTVLLGWKRYAGCDADSAGYTAEHEWVLKRHGGFNDDYTIPWVLLNISLSSGSKKLSESMPSPSQLASLVAAADNDVVGWVRNNYVERAPLDEVVEMGWNLYVGTPSNPGLHCLETPLVTTNWKDMPLPVGIYSGRNTIEWGFGKEKLGWEDFPQDNEILIDTGVCKPSPRGIEILAERMGFSSPLLFGDTKSDVKALRAFGGDGRFVAIGNLLPEEESYPSLQVALKAIFNL